MRLFSCHGALEALAMLCWILLLGRSGLALGFCCNTAVDFSLWSTAPSVPHAQQILMTSKGTGDVGEVDKAPPRRFYTTKQASFETKMTTSPSAGRWKRLIRFIWRRGSGNERGDEMKELSFDYQFNELALGSTNQNRQTTTTTGVLLIHPIGVGIARWFYDRLSDSLHSQYHAKEKSWNQNFLLVIPDLLGSGTASSPVLQQEDGTTSVVKKLPLLNISDWSDQIIHLMGDVEREHSIDNWCIVANGGCSPIALQVAQRSLVQQDASRSGSSVAASLPFQKQVTHVVLSSVPRLGFFLPSSPDPDKVKKSYRTLCGIPGKLFWWYALRNDGAFIQSFSEKNLVADPSNLGDEWRPNCVEAAKVPMSRYSTFAFLAGTLQDGCRESLPVILSSDVSIDFIKGRDKRRNRARSWFWQKSNKKKPRPERQPTLAEYVHQQNGTGGREVQVGGRISLAHEDAEGYAGALLQLIAT